MGFSRQEYWSGVPLPSPQHTVLMSYFPILFLEQLVKQAPWQSVSQVICHETVWPNVDHCLATTTMLTASHSFPIPHLPIVELLLFSRQVLSNSFVTLWTVARQAPLSMGFSKQEYWSGLPFPPPGHLPDPGIKVAPPMSPTLAGGFFTTEPLGKPPCHLSIVYSSVYPLNIIVA